MPSSSTGTIIDTEGMDLLLAQDSASDDATITISIVLQLLMIFLYAFAT